MKITKYHNNCNYFNKKLLLPIIYSIIVATFIGLFITYGFITYTYQSTSILTINYGDNLDNNSCDKVILNTIRNIEAEKIGINVGTPVENNLWLTKHVKTNLDKGVLTVSTECGNPYKCSVISNNYAHLLINKINNKVMHNKDSHNIINQIKLMGRELSMLGDEKRHCLDESKYIAIMNSYNRLLLSITGIVNYEKTEIDCKLTMNKKATPATEPYRPNRMLIMMIFVSIGIITGMIYYLRNIITEHIHRTNLI